MIISLVRDVECFPCFQVGQEVPGVVQDPAAPLLQSQVLLNVGSSPLKSDAADASKASLFVQMGFVCGPNVPTEVYTGLLSAQLTLKPCTCEEPSHPAAATSVELISPHVQQHTSLNESACIFNCMLSPSDGNSLVAQVSSRRTSDAENLKQTVN